MSLCQFILGRFKKKRPAHEIERLDHNGIGDGSGDDEVYVTMRQDQLQDQLDAVGLLDVIGHHRGRHLIQPRGQVSDPWATILATPPEAGQDTE